MDAQSVESDRSLRDEIVVEIMSMIRPVKIERTKPTIAELEAILNSDDPPLISLNPDGSCTELVPMTTTVGAVADKIVALIARRQLTEAPNTWSCAVCGANVGHKTDCPQSATFNDDCYVGGP